MRLAMISWVAGLALAAALPTMGAAEDIPATGQSITPEAARGAIFQKLLPDLPGAPGFAAGQAGALALSPDGRTLLIVTSGFNIFYGADGRRVPDLSREYVFVYDVSGLAPVKRQVLTIANTFLGLAWAPAGDRFYVTGGVGDDVVEYTGAPGAYAAARTIKLGHGLGLGLTVQAEAGPLSVSPDGRRLLVANVQNDSVSLVDLASGAVTDQDLRPGAIDAKHAGEPGGSFPRTQIFTPVLDGDTSE